VTDEQPVGESESGAGDTTASLDPETLAAHLDPSDPSPAPADARALVITRGPGAGSRYLIDRDETRIGRHPEAHILLDDVTVSRRHALLTVVDSQVVLTDQASLNGTYVAGERVDSHVLSDGDEVQIGRFHLVFQEGPVEVRDGTNGD
jgi:pSer/pThr/pTyr-binding forkhead associated (FHA) protein